MSNQITLKMLQVRVNELNNVLNQPTEYSKFGHPICNPGHYYIGQAYGRYRLEQLANVGGGARDISPSGTKREIWDYATAMIKGVEAAQGCSQ